MAAGKKPVEKMTPSKINQMLEKINDKMQDCYEELIVAGRGYEPHSEIMKKNDPLSLKYQELVKQRNILKDEIARRYGPGIYRCPIRRRKTQ